MRFGKILVFVILGLPKWQVVHRWRNQRWRPAMGCASSAWKNSNSCAKLYEDALGPDYASYFRDILKGVNGDCKSFCNAKRNYDTVTGLGSPIAYHY